MNDLIEPNERIFMENIHLNLGDEWDYFDVHVSGGAKSKLKSFKAKSTCTGKVFASVNQGEIDLKLIKTIIEEYQQYGIGEGD